MSEPVYHLRTNKAVERALFVELLRIVGGIIGTDYSDWNYVGFGASYMEDFNLLNKCFKFDRLISLEEKSWKHSRQFLNKSGSNITPLNKRSDVYLDEIKNTDGCFSKSSVIWLDHTGGAEVWIKNVQEICDFAKITKSPSILKLTIVPARPKELRGASVSAQEVHNWLENEFTSFGPFEIENTSKNSLYKSVYRIAKVIVRRAFQYEDEISAECISSNFYIDVSPILTITFLVGEIEKVNEILASLKNHPWKYFNFDWGEPLRIDVPDFSLRERIELDRLLPENDAEKILEKLRVQFAETKEMSCKLVENYIEFKQQVPSFQQVYY
ncbi:MAG: hypothetical protein MI748_02610 [Opitutales bacterium]|nr:hypothetical protein [Opitutales bacterium]